MQLLDRITALVVLVALLFVLCVPSLFVGWFKVEQDRIAATLCLQKKVPENTCQGNCQMSKMLKKVESNADQNTAPDPNRIEVKEIQMLFEYAGSDEQELTRTIAYNIASEKVLNGVKRNLFRPPWFDRQA